MVGHQQPAHQRRVAHHDLVLRPHAQVHHVAVNVAPVRQGAGQVARHPQQQAPAGQA